MISTDVIAHMPPSDIGARRPTVGQRRAEGLDDGNELERDGYGTGNLWATAARRPRQTRTPSVSARDCDLAITLQPPMNPNIGTVRLTPYRLGLFASAAYLDRHRTPSDLDSLRSHASSGMSSRF
jgi:hypothetical protein